MVLWILRRPPTQPPPGGALRRLARREAVLLPAPDPHQEPHLPAPVLLAPVRRPPAAEAEAVAGAAVELPPWDRA